MPSCVFKGCKNYSKVSNKTDHGITYHRFPRNVNLKLQWINVVRKNRKDPLWMPSDYSRVCSDHFDERDFYFTNKGGRYLAKHRCPKKDQTSTAFEEIGYLTSVSNPLTETITIETDPQSNIDEVNATTSRSACDSIAVYTYLTPVRTPSPIPMTEEEEARCDTPIRHRLRQKLKQKEKLYINHTKKNKVLKQTIRRLEKRNKMLQCKIKSIRKCNLMYPQMQDTLNKTVLDILKNLKRKAHLKANLKFTPEMKQFCVTLEHLSPKAYSLVRSTFHNCLPRRRTLAIWRRSKNNVPSISGNGETSQ